MNHSHLCLYTCSGIPKCYDSEHVKGFVYFYFCIINLSKIYTLGLDLNFSTQLQDDLFQYVSVNVLG